MYILGTHIYPGKHNFWVVVVRVSSLNFLQETVGNVACSQVLSEDLVDSFFLHRILNNSKEGMSRATLGHFGVTKVSF
jgi:hypothetical protein